VHVNVKRETKRDREVAFAVQFRQGGCLPSRQLQTTGIAVHSREEVLTAGLINNENFGGTMAKGTILVGGGGKDYAEPRDLLLRYGNRHGLVTGATGTGKTVTLQILAEGLSAVGVPVVIQDVKGDISGLSQPGDPAGKANESLMKRAAQIGMTDFSYRAYPVVFWDLFGQSGHPVRSTVSEMGPLLLSRMMELSEAQEGVLNIAFRVADEQGMALLDLKDLQAMLSWLADNTKEVGKTYGNVAPATVGAIQRALLILENQGAAGFLGEPALDLKDLIATDAAGMGRINVLMSDKLMQSPRLYAMFLLWLMSELFEQLPEVGDPDKPVLVFFFDEAHLLFNDSPKALVDKVVQVVRLIRSKGVGVYFCTQNPDDVPGDVLAQLGNRVQHALRAFTPRDAKALRQAAETFRPNPDFDTETAIREVGTGEAVVSLLEAKGVPAMVSRTLIRPPESRLGPITDAERRAAVAASPLAGKYDTAVDRESAQEILGKRAEAAAQQAAAAEEMLQQAEAREAELKQARRYEPTRSSRSTRQPPSFGSEIARTVVKQLGTRQGQQLVRGILGGLFKGR
jgi:DNA helicase HerA-like ATPase